MDEFDTIWAVTMPDTPRKRHRERRSKKQKLEPRRCANDNRKFQPKLKIQKFCSDQCRKQFHRYGSSYGPLKTGLEKIIKSMGDRIAEDVQYQIQCALAEFSPYKRIQQLEADIKLLHFAIGGLRASVEKLQS